MKNNNEGRIYYYRPTATPGVFKCAGFGAENQTHRAFYMDYFTKNENPSDSFKAGVPILSPYVGDLITP